MSAHGINLAWWQSRQGNGRITVVNNRIAKLQRKIARLEQQPA